MKKQIQEYLTYYSPEFIYIPFDNIDMLTLNKDGTVFNNMSLGKKNDGTIIYSTVSGIINGTKKMNYLEGESNSLIIENDFIDRRIVLNPFKEITKIKKTELNDILNKYGLYQKINSKTILVVNSTYNKKTDLGDMVINYESYEEILESIDELLELYNIKSCYIVIPKEDIYSEVAYNKYINAFPNICIVNSNKKFKNDKCVFYNIEDVLAVNKALHLDYILDNTMITISNDKTYIIKVKLYTPLSEVLKALKISFKDKTVFVNSNIIEDINSFVISKNVKSIVIK